MSSSDISSVLAWQPAKTAKSALSITDIPVRRGVDAKPRVIAQEVIAAKRRAQIRELHHSLHCSIVGTCLTTGELRRLLLRLNMKSAEALDDHGLHQLGVMLASGPSIGAKQLQKTLDRRHKLALNHFAKAKDSSAVEALWDEALKNGDIPGGYWSVLTHPATTEALVKRAFGEIHMLSHLVGAANRADIQRLRQLEAENTALADKIERQQQQLREGFTERDQAIRRLNDALANKASDSTGAGNTHGSEEARALSEALAERDRRLARETSRRERLEERLAGLAAEHGDAVRAREQALAECEALRIELASAEGRIAMLVPGDGDSVMAPSSLSGLTLLYVGGRAHLIPQLKNLVELSSGQFLHHDGGLEHSPALLPGLISRADLAVFPVDCVSHEAVAALKRTCRQLDKRYVPLRTSSLTSLLAGISTIDAADRQPARN
ncbi:MAG TPA: DUF2325 domain-containing protein [Xanthobacteraceae bacterium]|nr:DUF2325 domain-containing protein [Xanthobacteraceae bacterium]